MTKLNDKQVRWFVNQIEGGKKSVKQIALTYGITPRRVRQIMQAYRETGQMPTIKQNRRPKTELSEQQKNAVDTAFRETKLGSRLLYFELQKRGTSVPKSKLHAYMKAKGWTQPNKKKQKRRKRCRYERKHSGSLLHGDWHRTSENHPHVILWMDDASRKILAGYEGEKSGKMSIHSLNEAKENAWKDNIVISQVNTDRGSEFHSNKGGKSKFSTYLNSCGIKHVLSRVNNPQTNGKIERHWREYDQHRHRFATLREFIDWYNNRLHGALCIEWAETPNEAWMRKSTPESMIGRFFK